MKRFPSKFAALFAVVISGMLVASASGSTGQTGWEECDAYDPFYDGCCRCIGEECTEVNEHAYFECHSWGWYCYDEGSLCRPGAG
jgi:hypothetical protein